MQAAYERVLARRPVAVKTLTGAVVSWVSDALAQRIEDPVAPYDSDRGNALTSLGAVWNGPCLHVYFEWLERLFPQRRGLHSMAPKVLITQLILNPFIYLPMFYSWTAIYYGRSVDETLQKVRREYWPSLYAAWAVFTPVNLANFYYVPVRHQVNVTLAASFVFNTAISLIAAPRQSDVAVVAQPDSEPKARSPSHATPAEEQRSASGSGDCT